MDTIKSQQDLDRLRAENEEDFDKKYIVVENKEIIKCKHKSPPCFCRVLVFQIRPYTFEILSAFQPFFELLAFSSLHFTTIEQIINHIEDVLNLPIKEAIKRYQEQNGNVQVQQ